MATKFEGGEEFEPVLIPPVRIENGKMVVPATHAKHYAEIWKFQHRLGIHIDKVKIDYFKQYEAKNGVITHWTKLNGTQQPMPAAAKSAGWE